MSFSRFPQARAALACALAVSLAFGTAHASAAAPAARPALTAFFENAAYRAPQLSPDGKRLALIVSTPGKFDSLAVIDLSDQRIYPSAAFGNINVGQFQWVNNQRLLFNTKVKGVAVVDRMFGPGLYAANFDGSQFKQLAERRAVRGGTALPGSANNRLLPYHTFLLGQAGAQDSDAAYVASADFGAQQQRIEVMNLLHLDTVTGRTRSVERPLHTQQWLLDAKGEPRLLTTVQAGMEQLHYRDPVTSAWRPLNIRNAAGVIKEQIEPLGFDAQGQLYVALRAGQDKAAVYTVDPASSTLNERALVILPDYDFRGHLVVQDGKLLGVRTMLDAATTIWFDPAMKAVQEQVDAQLPNTVNLISVPAKAQAPWLLIHAFSDRQPQTYHVFNRQTKALVTVGSARPQIDPATMATQQLEHYKARDGMSIPAFLTLPPGSSGKQLPMVVLLHDGPHVRGNGWGWDNEMQFLASRGYAVLAPEFRGSAGFGAAHLHAGFKQWGLAMQNDVADAAKWAIAKGIADPKRICVAGGGYGGYAALMGLVNDPGLFKCGVEWMGTTELKQVFEKPWNPEAELPQELHSIGWRGLVGDPQTDAARFKATSPLAQAARIRQPLLMAYGADDAHTPLASGMALYQAIKQTNPDVEFIAYPGEGHGWDMPATRMDFWGRVEKFLDRQIGTPK